MAVCVVCIGCTSGEGKRTVPTPLPSSTKESTQTVVMKFFHGSSYVPLPKISSLPVLPGVRECHFWVSGLISNGGQSFEVDLTVLAEKSNSTLTQLASEYPAISIGLAGPAPKPETSLPASPTSESQPNNAGPMDCAGTSY
jgi:hypothetical protein